MSFVFIGRILKEKTRRNERRKKREEQKRRKLGGDEDRRLRITGVPVSLLQY